MDFRQMLNSDSDDEETFNYPDSSISPSENSTHIVAREYDSEDEEFVYPGVSSNGAEEQYASSLVPASSTTVASGRQSPSVTAVPEQQSPLPPVQHASPAQLEALYAASSSGDLRLLKNLFRNALQSENVEAFALANDASSRTGLTALHAAASRGYLDIVKWLMEDCGAMPDLEDKEGETALHKAALHGHLSIIKYLLPGKADVHARDADGWTALHNACSKGYLDIVRWLCENAGAASEVDGVRGVDLRSKGGWTPLMNAASKGHLPVVNYLLTKQSANPLVRNNWGETAYDAAAAVFEVWICEVLQKAEADRWRRTTTSYDPLAVHTTVPLVLYENQRLDARLKTLAVSGGRPKFSASGLGKQGRRAPFELKLPKSDESGKKEVPAWRSDVHLPFLDEPFKLPQPSKEDMTSQGAERSHFWLSDWTLDVTPPGVDAEEGWQYARMFQDPDDQWTSEPPPQLERLLNGGGAVVAGLSGSSSGANGTHSRSSSQSAQSWVRRRRWVRVMRRRLDIPPIPFMEPDGNMYHLAADGTLIPIMSDSDSAFAESSGQELGSMPSSGLLAAGDYVARARYLAGNDHDDTTTINGNVPSALDARRAIAKLERATTELRQGILGDVDPERKTHAEILLDAYTRELERRRLQAGAKGLLILGSDAAPFEDDDDDEEEFHYPGASPSYPQTPRASSIRSGRTDYFGHSSVTRVPNDLTPQLSQAPEFRVPTHEAPQKVLTPRWTPPTPHQVHAQWERDNSVSECRDCHRRFNFITRRHCRRCGRIFCDRCSAYRAVLDPSDVVYDPAFPESTSSASSHRVCRSCYEEVNVDVPSPLQIGGSRSMERIVVDQARLSVSPIGRRRSSSQISDLNECPVCGHGLEELGPSAVQEAHVKLCLEGGTGTSPPMAKYLVYKLPAESALIGVECRVLFVSKNSSQDLRLHVSAVYAAFIMPALLLGCSEDAVVLFMQDK